MGGDSFGRLHSHRRGSDRIKTDTYCRAACLHEKRLRNEIGAYGAFSYVGFRRMLWAEAFDT